MVGVTDSGFVVESAAAGGGISALDQLRGEPARLYHLFQGVFLPFLRGYAYLMAKDGKQVGEMLTADVSKLTAGSFFESIGTLRQTDLRPRLSELRMPVFGGYGKKDIIVDPKQSKVLKQYVPHSRIEWFEHSGHFPMLDESENFHAAVRDFLYNG